MTPDIKAGKRTSFLLTAMNSTDVGLTRIFFRYRIVARWPVSPKLLMAIFFPTKSFADVMSDFIATKL